MFARMSELANEQVLQDSDWKKFLIVKKEKSSKKIKIEACVSDA